MTETTTMTEPATTLAVDQLAAVTGGTTLPYTPPECACAKTLGEYLRCVQGGPLPTRDTQGGAS